jgi:hypothetical protein
MLPAWRNAGLIGIQQTQLKRPKLDALGWGYILMDMNSIQTWQKGGQGKKGRPTKRGGLTPPPWSLDPCRVIRVV